MGEDDKHSQDINHYKFNPCRHAVLTIDPKDKNKKTEQDIILSYPVRQKNNVRPQKKAQRQQIQRIPFFQKRPDEEGANGNEENQTYDFDRPFNRDVKVIGKEE